MTDITLPMTRSAELTPAGYARRVIAQTASAWNIAPASPRAVASDARLEDALAQGLRWAI